MNLDQSYIDQIKGFEGYRDRPYWDYKQYTSGYGTRANSPDEVIDRATAEQRLQGILGQAASRVDSLNPNLPAGTRAALISLTYNAGPGWMQAGLGDMIRNNQLEAAKERFLEYNKAGGLLNPGLVSRRAAEAAWFGAGSPQATAQQPAPASPPAPMQAAPTALNFAPQAIAQQAPQAAPQAAPMEFPAEQMAQAPPITFPQRKPPDLRALRAALARPQGGFFLARG